MTSSVGLKYFMDQIEKVPQESRPTMQKYSNSDGNVISWILGAYCLVMLRGMYDDLERLRFLLESREFVPHMRTVLNYVNKPTLTKKEMGYLYGVDRKLFSKWMVLLTSFNTINVGVSAKRRMSLTSFGLLFQELGNPEIQKVLRKKDIAELDDTDYRGLLEKFKYFLYDKGYDEEVYGELSKFPPKLIQDYLKWCGDEESNGDSDNF